MCRYRPYSRLCRDRSYSPLCWYSPSCWPRDTRSTDRASAMQTSSVGPGYFPCSRLRYFHWPPRPPASPEPARRRASAVRLAAEGAARRERPLSTAGSSLLLSAQQDSRMETNSMAWSAKAYRAPHRDTSNGAWWSDRCGSTSGRHAAFDPSGWQGNRRRRARRRRALHRLTLLSKRRPRESWRRLLRRIARFALAWVSPVMIRDISRCISPQKLGSQCAPNSDSMRLNSGPPSHPTRPLRQF